MRKLVYLLVSLSVSFLMMGGAQAAKENWSWMKDLPEYQPTVEKYELHHFLADQKEYEKQEKISRANASRKIAQTANETQTTPPKLAALIAKINAVQTAGRLDELLAKIDETIKDKDGKDTGVIEYDSYADTPDAQFLLAQLATLRVYRGLFYRLRPMLKPNSLISSGITHSMLVTFARQLAASTQIYFPQSQWKAGYSYISEPLDLYYVFKDDGRSGLGRKAMEVFQQWLEEDVYHTLTKAAGRMQALAKMNRRFVWDNKIVFASEKFESGFDQHRIIGRTECLALYSAYVGALAGIKMFTAYNMNDLINVNFELGKSIGFDSMGNDVTGMSAEDRQKVIDRFDRFLKARPDSNGSTSFTKFEDRMRLAYGHIKEATSAAKLVWDETNGKGDDVWRILDPGAFRPFNRVIESSIVTMKRVVDSADKKEGELVKSAVTGEPVHIFYSKFFLEDPPRNLQVFLPNKFYGGSDTYPRELTIAPGKKVNADLRNYDKGRATGWQYSEFMKYSPEASSEAGVKLVSRVLMQSWGGWAFGIPLAFVVQ